MIAKDRYYYFLIKRICIQEAKKGFYQCYVEHIDSNVINILLSDESLEIKNIVKEKYFTKICW